MKTRLFLLSLVVSAFISQTQTAYAKIWRVNNKSNYNGSTTFGENYGGTNAYPVFEQINQAVGWTSVKNGDTLHIEGSPDVYEQADISKRLVIIGAGYFLADNPKTSNDLLDSRIYRVEFEAGSEGSVLIGVNIGFGNSGSGYVIVNVNTITVKRCRIERGIAPASGLQMLTVLQNFFPSTYNTSALTIGNAGFVPPVDLIFNNNIVQKTLVWTYGNGNPGKLTQCRNNIFDGPDNLATPSLKFATTDFQNNILIATGAIVEITANAADVAYNIGTQSAQFGTANNNLVVPNTTSLFVGGTSPDGQYLIKSGSQAFQNGSDGADRGAFGGFVVTSRYTLSGLAPVPVVYQATTTGVVTPSGLPVTIKARTIK